MKRLIKRLVTHVAGRWMRGDNSPQVGVLCYHSIHPSSDFASATPQLFEEHLRWLSTECRVVGLNMVLSRARAGRLDKPEVAITFDDGMADNFEIAFPLLQKYGLTATFFLTAGLLERSEPTIRRFRELRHTTDDGIRPMEWSNVREMLRSGMSAGSHTYSHPNLAQLSGSDALRELWVSRDILEQRLGCRVDSLAYPFGKPGRHFTEETIEIAVETGYELAVAAVCRTVVSGDSRFDVPRFFVARDDVAALREKVSGWWNVVGWLQEALPARLARILSPLDFQPHPTWMPGCRDSRLEVR